MIKLYNGTQSRLKAVHEVYICFAIHKNNGSLIHVCVHIYIFFRSRKTHPGAVVHLSDNPLDLSKVRVFFEYVFFALLFHPYHNFIIDIIQFYRDA